jgi:hypothetical protein
MAKLLFAQVKYIKTLPNAVTSCGNPTVFVSAPAAQSADSPISIEDQLAGPEDVFLKVLEL